MVGVAALLVLALGAAGCSGDDTSAAGATPVPTPTTTPSGTPTAEATSRYPTYVALGDSYTAAPLVPDTDTSNGCLRSSNNYPALVAAAMPGTRLYDVSCSGADTASMTGVQRTGDQEQPAQLDALTKDTDLVTLGIGGNDFDLFGTLVGVCPQLRSSDPTGNPCERQLSNGGQDRLTQDLRGIQAHVAAVVAEIRERAPHATVVVVGYPQILPPKGTCPQLLALATGDYAYARRINQGLADAVERGARGADAYVDVFRASAGHDICSADPWVNGMATDVSRALAFHPFAAEQRAVADLVLDQL
ncbi:MAG: Lipase 2 precursor [Nocardioides sp.]|nr:Lipase 2 precursor [Nocardioides sp.]